MLLRQDFSGPFACFWQFFDQYDFTWFSLEGYISVDTNTCKMQEQLLCIHECTHFPPHTNVPLIFLNLHSASMARHRQWGLQGSFSEERLGLQRAGHRQFQLASTDPLQDTAKPLNQGGDTSGKTYIRKRRKCWTGRGRRKRV